MNGRLKSEDGVALIVAIFSIAVVGGILTGAFFMGMQEQAVGRNQIGHGNAFASAEAGVETTLSNWTSLNATSLARGDSVTFSGWLADSSGWYRGSVRRSIDNIFLIRSEGFSADSLTRQQVGFIVRNRPFDLGFDAALTTQGATKIGGSSFIDGDDHIPSGWTGCSLDPARPGIIIDDASEISTSGCRGLNCVNGSPKIEEDTTITADSLTTFGDLDVSGFASFATHTLGSGPYNGIGPSFSGGACNTADFDNWGDPLNPASACGGYFPILYAPNGTKMTGGYGQGILVVNGDLEVQGGFEFYGPVIVAGVLNTKGTGGHFNGGVIAANVNLDQNTVLGNAVINYSSCAIQYALSAASPVGLMRERAWALLN